MDAGPLSASGGQRPACKCCSTPSALVGWVDFNKTCEDEKRGQRAFPLSAEMVPYFACPHCGFIFTPYCDAWTEAEFRERIYNADYVKADRDYDVSQGIEKTRGYSTGLFLAAMLAKAPKNIRILDYGAGGNPGLLQQAMESRGFTEVTSYEPFMAENVAVPQGKFDLVLAMEVIEHSPDPVGILRKITSFMAEDAIFFFTTNVHGFPTPANIMESWYIAPRNGHISIHSTESLPLVIARLGLHLHREPFGLFAFKDPANFNAKLGLK